MSSIQQITSYVPRTVTFPIVSNSSWFFPGSCRQVFHSARRGSIYLGSGVIESIAFGGLNRLVEVFDYFDASAPLLGPQISTDGVTGMVLSNFDQTNLEQNGVLECDTSVNAPATHYFRGVTSGFTDPALDGLNVLAVRLAPTRVRILGLPRGITTTLLAGTLTSDVKCRGKLWYADPASVDRRGLFAGYVTELSAPNTPVLVEKMTECYEDAPGNVTLINSSFPDAAGASNLLASFVGTSDDVVEFPAGIACPHGIALRSSGSTVTPLTVTYTPWKTGSQRFWAQEASARQTEFAGALV